MPSALGLLQGDGTSNTSRQRPGEKVQRAALPPSVRAGIVSELERDAGGCMQRRRERDVREGAQGIQQGCKAGKNGGKCCP